MEVVNRDRNRARNMTGLVFAHRPSVENDHVARAKSFEELLETNRLGSPSVTELLMNEALEVGKPALGDILDSRGYLEHRWIGEAVIDKQALFAAFDQCGLLQRLKVLRGIGEGESRLGGERVDGAFRLGEQFQEFQSVWIAERFADSGELAVQAILEVTVRGHMLK